MGGPFVGDGHWKGRLIDGISLVELYDRNNGHGKQGRTPIEDGHWRDRLIDWISVREGDRNKGHGKQGRTVIEGGHGQTYQLDKSGSSNGRGRISEKAVG